MRIRVPTLTVAAALALAGCGAPATPASSPPLAESPPAPASAPVTADDGDWASWAESTSAFFDEYAAGIEDPASRYVCNLRSGSCGAALSHYWDERDELERQIAASTDPERSELQEQHDRAERSIQRWDDAFAAEWEAEMGQ